MAVKHVDNALRVGVACIHELAGLRLTLVGYICEASLQSSVQGVNAAHNLVRLLAVLQLVLVTHLKD